MTYSRLRLILAATALCAASDLHAAKTVLDCRSDHGAVTAAICGSPEYIAMIREIDALTDRAMTKFNPGDRRRLAQSQIAYFHKRQGCGWAAHNSAHPGVAVDECVRASLEGRVRALRVLVERGGF